MRRAAALGAIAAGLAAPRLASAQTMTTVRIGADLIDPFLEPWYAQDQGMFARAGLQAQLNTLSSNASLQALIGGSLDASVSDLLQIANAHLRGVDVVVIAGGAHYDSKAPTIALVVPNDSPIHTAGDLAGKTVAVPALKATTSIAVQEWLRKSGADPTAVHLIEIPLSAVNAALARGTVDCALSGEPFLTAAKADNRVLAYPFSAIADQFYTGVWVSRSDYADQHAATVQKLIGVIYESARWANTHQPETAVIEANLTHIPFERVKSMVRNRFSTSLDGALAQPLLDVSFRYGLIPQQLQAASLFWKGSKT